MSTSEFVKLNLTPKEMLAVVGRPHLASSILTAMRGENVRIVDLRAFNMALLARFEVLTQTMEKEIGK